MIRVENQTKYGSTKDVNFIIVLFKKWLKNYGIEMSWIHNEGKPVVAGRFIRTLNPKIYKQMTSISKDVYIHQLDDIANEYNHTHHITVRMKPADVKYNTYIYSVKVSSNDKDTKFKVGDFLRISQCKNFFSIGYTPNWLEEGSLIKKVKNTVLWTYIINELNDDEKNNERLINNNSGQKK